MKGQNALVILGILCLASILVSQTPINSNSTNLQLFPKVAYTNGGNYLFTWVSNHESPHHECEVYSRSAGYSGSNFTPTGTDRCLSVPTDGRAGHRLHAEIIPSVKGTDKGAIVAWIDHKKIKIYARRITSTGAFDDQWSTTMDELYVHPANPYVYTPPEMCETTDGGAIFVWVEKSGDPVQYTLKARKIPSTGSGGWTEEIIDPTTNSITLPRICADGNGGAKIAWVEPDPDAVRWNGAKGVWWIRLGGVTSNGNPHTIVGVDTTNYSYYNPLYSYNWTGLNIARGSNYTVVGMKHQYSYFEDDPVPSRTTVSENIYVRRVPDSGPIGSRQELDSYNYSGTHYQRPLFNKECYSCLGSPVVVASSDGGAYVAWNHGTWNAGNGSRNNDSEVYVAKINSSGNEVWMAYPSYLGCAYGYNSTPQIVGLDNNANAAVVWQSFQMSLDPATDCRVYVSKVSSSGSFTTPQSVGNDANAWSFDAVSTGSGTVVTWSDKSGGDWNIHAEKISF